MNQVVLMLYFSNILRRRRTPIVPAKRPVCGHVVSAKFHRGRIFGVEGVDTSGDVTRAIFTAIATEPAGYGVDVDRDAALDS